MGVFVWGDVLLGVLSCFKKLAVASELDVLLKSEFEFEGALEELMSALPIHISLHRQA